MESSKERKTDSILGREHSQNVASTLSEAAKEVPESSDSLSSDIPTKEIRGPHFKFPISERPVFQTINITKFSPSLSRSINQSATVSPAPTIRSTNRSLNRIPARRGIDIVTGWEYEEDPKTKVRNWIRTPNADIKSAFL
ncbi:uncharacterized protein LOC134243698 [Saccostrea cucullata]|uniref:uncharacterized protein LOC134243698 n=1 Tax=Saccostrea cuccullata TaxID=36930 RepID=UPI002ED5AEA5